MDIVRDTYEQLRRDYAMSEYDFSENWLKKSKGYFAYLKCTGSQPSLEAILALYGEAKLIILCPQYCFLVLF